MTPADLCLIVTTASTSLMPLSEERVRLACDLAPEIIESSQGHSVDPLLLTSLIYVESRWNPTAKSWAGACGLTQVVPKWHPETCEELKDPRIAVEAGSRALRTWLDHGKSVRRGLACYNAGYACLSNDHARKYADKVLKYHRRLQSLQHLTECADVPVSVQK